jgi:hypothetical protein
MVNSGSVAVDAWGMKSMRAISTLSAAFATVAWAAVFVDLVHLRRDGPVVDGRHRLALLLRQRPGLRRDRLHDVTRAGEDVVVGVRLRGVVMVERGHRVDDQGAVEQRADQVVHEVELLLLDVPARVVVPRDRRALRGLGRVLDLLLHPQQGGRHGPR